MDSKLCTGFQGYPRRQRQPTRTTSEYFVSQHFARPSMASLTTPIPSARTHAHNGRAPHPPPTSISKRPMATQLPNITDKPLTTFPIERGRGSPRRLEWRRTRHENGVGRSGGIGGSNGTGRIETSKPRRKYQRKERESGEAGTEEPRNKVRGFGFGGRGSGWQGGERKNQRKNPQKQMRKPIHTVRPRQATPATSIPIDPNGKTTSRSSSVAPTWQTVTRAETSGELRSTIVWRSEPPLASTSAYDLAPQNRTTVDTQPPTSQIHDVLECGDQIDQPPILRLLRRLVEDVEEVGVVGLSADVPLRT
ncbi:hypothetical protein FA13DRAFT_1777720 [Coprinellus micaceus]|uniref:Uncharacterized protein n=1 Tax=Coprinellus micaceus TaxID=71717 RepID=A0A4Y7SSI2_COPMI|nr:hypothetical protein FA13DRAFT_1777720 [Coprinellus micaceus]